jgi:hypothetical protein
VLAGVECQQRRGRVRGMRGRDVDDVDVGIGDERLPGAVGVRDVMLSRERLGPLLRAAADADDPQARRLQVLGEGPGDAARREDAPTEIAHA